MARRLALPSSSARKRCGKFNAQSGEVAFDTAVAADQNVVVIGQPLFGQRGTEQLPEAALHAVANHRIADLFGDGDAVAFAQPPIRMGQKHETGTCDTQAPVSGNEIRAALDDRDGRRALAQLRRRASCDHARGGRGAPYGRPG